MSLDESLKSEIIKGISLTGAASEKNRASSVIIGSKANLHLISSVSSGSPKINKAFSLILSVPQALSSLSPFEIRCCLCKNVIRYPAWYWSVKYAVNQFHFFICFDSDSKTKVSTRCYRRGL